jgi:hypothetical protein
LFFFSTYSITVRARAEARNRLKKEERARLKEVSLEVAHTKTRTHKRVQESELGISFAPTSALGAPERATRFVNTPFPKHLHALKS